MPRHTSVRLLTILCVLWIANPMQAQNEPVVRHGPGVEAHAGLDAVYRTFHEGYETLTPKTVADLYTENALYLSPNDDVVRGRSAVEDNFRSFFGSVRESGDRLRIRFEILDRDVSEDLAYDVGYYILQRTSGDDTSTHRGKFVVVARRGADGVWKFHVDGYSGVPTPETERDAP